MVSYSEFTTVTKFLLSHFTLGKCDIDEKEELLKTFISEIFSDDSKLSVEVKEEMCMIGFGLSISKIKKNTQKMCNTDTGHIMESGRYPHMLTMTEFERELYFGLVNGLCDHGDKSCECRYVIPYSHKNKDGETGWSTLLEEIWEIYPNANEFIILDIKKTEKYFNLSPKILENVGRYLPVKVDNRFYQAIRKSKYAYRGYRKGDEKHLKFYQFDDEKQINYYELETLY